MSYEEWKARLAVALETQFGRGAGEGLIHIENGAEQAWREAYDAGLTPEDMAYQEFACMLADEGND